MPSKVFSTALFFVALGLMVDIREINRNLPFEIQMIHCTLDQVANNCRLITRS
jgi:Kef-type K+ transport system membrane component KefB